MNRFPLWCALLTLAACERSPAPSPEAGPTPASAAIDYGLPGWAPPSLDSIPADSLGNSIRRGLHLFRHTRDSLPEYATSSLNCTSCHLNDGLRLEAAPLTGTFARYPKYMARAGIVVPLADRVNYCITRSLAGNKLAAESREMQDIISFIAYISAGVPIGARIAGATGILSAPDTLEGNAATGATLFAAKCSACHGAEGQGMPAIPALWGPKSYSIGASMARRERAASFIQHNMPLGLGGTLTWQEAFDLSAFINSHPRPDSPGKQDDWPLGGAPPDVPYDTRGHVAVNPPPSLVPRRHPDRAIVPPPAPVGRRSGGRS